MKTISILFCLLFSFASQAIEVEELIRQVKETYQKAPKIEYTSKYELFKGHYSEQVHTSYDGYIYRDGKQVYQKIKQTEFIYGADFFLQINHEEKAIALDLAQQNISREVELDEVLKNCKEQKVEEKETYYLVTLVYNAIAETPFSSVKIKIDKRSKHLLQLDLYYTINQDFSTDFKSPDLAQPHLRISLSNINMHPKKKEELLAFSSYLKTTDNLLKPTAQCNGYELIDNRLK